VDDHGDDYGGRVSRRKPCASLPPAWTGIEERTRKVWPPVGSYTSSHTLSFTLRRTASSENQRPASWWRAGEPTMHAVVGLPFRIHHGGTETRSGPGHGDSRMPPARCAVCRHSLAGCLERKRRWNPVSSVSHTVRERTGDSSRACGTGPRLSSLRVLLLRASVSPWFSSGFPFRLANTQHSTPNSQVRKRQQDSAQGGGSAASSPGPSPGRGRAGPTRAGPETGPRYRDVRRAVPSNREQRPTTIIVIRNRRPLSSTEREEKVRTTLTVHQ